MCSLKRKILAKIVAIIIIEIVALPGCKGILPAGTLDTKYHIPEDESEVPRISAEELKYRLDSGKNILIVDVRSRKAFNTQHIAGAISVPVNEVESRLNEFHRDQDIVFYCT